MNKPYPSETIEIITKFLFAGRAENDLKKSDLVIVLGNDYIKGTIEKINDFCQKDIIAKNAKIILSGATGMLDADKDLECNRLYNCAVDEFGMDKNLFIKEPQATNAYLNFLYSKNIIDKIGGFDKFNTILVVGKAFLIRRAKMYASKLGYPQNKMQYYGTVDKEGINIDPACWWESDNSVKRVMAEIERIGKYALNGDLSIF